MIDTGIYYNDIVANIVDILTTEKENIGVKRVFGSIPPFIPNEYFPTICVTRQNKITDNFVIVPAKIRPEVVVDVWIQYAEIDQLVLEKVKNDIGYAEKIENEVGILTQKTEAILRKNRTLNGYCQESQVREVDFRFRAQPARPQTIVAGSIINFWVQCKLLSI